ncbi:hypothetical protein NHX12_008371 [Muraenolepis orangiensis]|uniref:Uncharacterized protein n=1 Tax=Muraenolepis orangiensis TaxID=630683 RepID=A0A9Q0DNQ3_9TELE|nr:hypothetical protein NHX12_008371 [Muraenolepis orangiensis]
MGGGRYISEEEVKEKEEEGKEEEEEGKEEVEEEVVEKVDVLEKEVEELEVEEEETRPRSTDSNNYFTVFPLHSWADLPPAHKPAPPPPKKDSEMKGHLTSDDIQVVHLDKDDDMQKLPLQPPYYDIAPSESTAFTDKMYAELDTSALASSVGPRSPASPGGPGELVEYATIQPGTH